MAPERFRGLSLRQGDIYALGATLYELPAFRPAFEAADQLALMARICHRSPTPPGAIDRRIPRDLETIVLKAMAKEPTDRYATAAALAEDLGRFGEDRPIGARRSSLPERAWRWVRRNPALAGPSTAVALILAPVAVGSTAAAVRFNRDAEANRRLLVQQSIAAVLRACPRLVQVWGHEDGVISATYDASGRRVLTASSDHTAQVWDAVTGAPITPRLRHADSVRHAAFSPPDGRRIVTASLDGSARVWDADDGASLTPAFGPGKVVRHATFSPTGFRIATAVDDGTARIWDFRPDPRPSGDLIRIARVLAGHQLREPGGLSPIGPGDLRRDWPWLRTRHPSQFTPIPGPTPAVTSPRP